MNTLEGAQLSTYNLVRDFGRLRAVNEVSITIGSGEIRGLIGPNGSGKTTLVNLITGVYPPTRGQIIFNNERIDKLSPDYIAGKGIIRTFQIPRVFRDMTVMENMMVPALAQGDSRRKAKKRALELLEFVLLARLKDQMAKNLSGGQTMLLQIARGLMKNPLYLYILDEPFAGVHPLIKNVIIRTIKEINEQGTTFLIVSHEMTTIRRLCTRVSVLHQGSLIAEGTMEEVARDPQVIDAYLGG